MADTRTTRLFQIGAHRLLRRQFDWHTANLRIAILKGGTAIDFENQHFLADFPTASILLDDALEGTKVEENFARAFPKRWLGVSAPEGVGGYLIYEVATASYRGRSGVPLVFGSQQVSSSLPVDELTDIILFFPATVGGPFYL